MRILCQNVDSYLCYETKCGVDFNVELFEDVEQSVQSGMRVSSAIAVSHFKPGVKYYASLPEVLNGVIIAARAERVKSEVVICHHQRSPVQLVNEHVSWYRLEACRSVVLPG